MTLVLHLAPGTIALCAHAALEEANLAHDLRWLDFRAGDQRGAAHLALNPKGRVPVLETPHGPLTETIAILEWIADTAHPALMPAEPWQAARARETMAFLASTVHVNHAHKLRGARWSDDPAAQASMKSKVAENMRENAAYLEGRLAEDWVAGDFSAADLYLWAVVRWLPGDGVPLADFPLLAAHADRVAGRPAVARAAALHAR